MSSPWVRAKIAFLIIATLLAFTFRVAALDTYGLSEDEVNKVQAIDQYRLGHFSANAEHPMLMKLAMWGSLDIARAWNRVAPREWSLPLETALRLPNAIAGVATTPVMFGIADRAATAPSSSAHSGVERHHYTIAARVRPLVVFWINREGVGDAVVTRRRAPGEARYSLLIGSDPDRAPLHINRWGYIEEEIHGADARLLGLMTESEEESIEQAEANIRRQSSGRRTFKVIQANADGQEARARVMSIAAPEDYTFRHLQIVLGLAQRDWPDGQSRVIRLPSGARPGFLAALADVMHAPSANPITYVYYGRLYELRRTRADGIPNFRIAHTSYGPAVAADFLITSTSDGERTRFSMTYGTEGAFAEVPLRVMYQPRWWMQVELTIDDAADASGLTDRVPQ